MIEREYLRLWIMRTYEGQEITLELYKTDDDIDEDDDHELSDGGEWKFKVNKMKYNKMK